MLCRLCLSDHNNYQKLEGAICDMLKAVLRQRYMHITDSVICYRCVEKVQTAYNFKTATLRAQKILSLYGGSDTKIVYVRDNKLCLISKTGNTIKLCKTCLGVIEHNFCINLLGRYDIIDLLRVYIPEVVIGEKDTLICTKCLDNFSIFSEIITTINDTEKLITRYCKEKGVTNDDEVTMDSLISVKKDSQDSNILRLLGDNDILDLETEFNNSEVKVEESKKRIIKKIIEEDVDLFYKEKPDFNIDDTFSEDSVSDSDQGNIFLGIQSGELLLSDFEEYLQYKNIDHTKKEPSSLRLSFETEESSLSPGALSDRQFDDYEEGQEDERTDASEATSPNPFIFFNDYEHHDEDACGCEDVLEQPRQKSKRKSCEKCKWKKVFGFNTKKSNQERDDNMLVKRPKKEGKKCRKAYGIEFKDLWCTQCRWKKACTRFGNAKAVSRR